MDELAEFLPKTPSKEMRAEISAKAQDALRAKGPPPDRVVEAIASLTLEQYHLVDPGEDQSLADLTARSVLKVFNIKQRRILADRLCLGIEEAFSLISEATPHSEQPCMQPDPKDGYSELESPPNHQS